MLLIRGRVDHQEGGEIKLIAQDVELFEPSAEEVEEAAAQAAVAAVPRRLTLYVAPEVPDSFIEDLRDVVETCRGEQELMLRVGERSLLLGPDFRVSGDGACRSRLDQLEGTARVVA